MQHYSGQNIIQTITMLILLCLLQSANAVLPPTLNYQGHLTDNAGTPIDGPVTMSFAIYDVDSGGTALWGDTRSVTIDQGVFSVELGGGVNVFPLGLFENPLWMGLTVGSDAEMTPRRPISSAAFSFKADDANTLEGVSAGTLDQSTHVTDTGNPHVVTPAQIGAADASDLSAHTGDTSNPHVVTPAQIGATRQTEFDIHKTNNSAHHSRYTNTEAVTAMGLQHDSNSLNHSKYTDTNAVSAMLANDGAGSTLDSDKVDGLDASELIDAAQDEVRTPISSLPFTINTSGSYYLTGNLDGSSGGINIDVDDVTLDLMGFTIDGGGTINDAGINFTLQSNVTIRNGTIKNFGRAGIYQGNSAGRYATVIDVQVLGNGTLGTSNSDSGINILSSNSHIERCTAGDNGGYAIYTSNSSKLINNTAYGSAGTYGIHGGPGSILSGNTAHNVDSTYAIYGSYGSILTGNTAFSNSSTYAIYGASGANLIGNSVYFNEHWGIYGNNANLIKSNTIYSNNTTSTSNRGGIRVGADSYVTGNKLGSNNVNNIYVDLSDNVIEYNVVTGSTNGINFVAASGNYFGGNKASGNTNAWLNYAGQTDGGNNYSF